MKKYVGLSILIVVVGLGILWALAGPGALRVFGGDRSMLADLTYDFLEDLKYKDFRRASSYHLPATQEKRDIPEMIRRVFQIRHEVLDIQSFKILEVDFDRGGERARVRAQVFFRVLGDQKMRDHVENDRNVEMLFYWFRQADGGWVMELESSLR